MSECVVRRGGLGDLGEILVVERACAEAPHWSEAIWTRLLAEGSVERATFVAELRGEIVGFVVAGMGAGVAEMESVAVMATSRRQGVGRALCVTAMEWARAMGLQTMELEVRATSAAALGMYGSLGFWEQGRRRRYYRDPAEDAALMVVKL